MVAVKLWYLLWYYGLLGNQKASTLMHKYNHNTLTTLRTSVRESLQMHFKVAGRNFHAFMQAGNSLTDISGHYQHPG